MEIESYCFNIQGWVWKGSMSSLSNPIALESLSLSSLNILFKWAIITGFGVIYVSMLNIWVIRL